MSTAEVPVFLYRRCRDGSLATVVRRRPHAFMSSGTLTLSRPELPALGEVNSAATPLDTNRGLRFLFPYEKATIGEVTERSVKTYRRREGEPKAETTLQTNLSLRDFTERIVEQFELRRKHHDVVARRRLTRRDPLPLKPFSFSVQTVPQMPAYHVRSVRKLKEGRNTLELAKPAQALADLGFEDENRAMSLRLERLLAHQATPGITHTEPTPVHQRQKPKLPQLQHPDDTFLRSQLEATLPSKALNDGKPDQLPTDRNSFSGKELQ